MLVEITTTAANADDLGFLLHKNPSNVFERDLGYGAVRVFYPGASAERTTAVLWLDLDQVGLVRSGGDGRFALAQYVNDRPYVASSFVSVALGQAFSSALAGRSKERQERADEAWPITVNLPALDCDAGADFIQGLFAPLGYGVETTHLPLDEHFPEWGESTLYRLTLTAEIRIADLLSHLYVLIPVLDNQKHYAIGAAEVTKLLDNAGEWLASHPMRDAITRRYLRYRREFVEDAQAALDRLVSTNDESPIEDPESAGEAAQAKEDTLERPLRLHDQRLDAVAEALKHGLPGARKVVDLGCGEGRLLKLLLKDSQWAQIVGMDVAAYALKTAARRLHLDNDGSGAARRVTLMHGSLLYRDNRLTGFDSAALVEVIEHIEPSRLEFAERVVFRYARPGRVVITTPNAEYNAHWTSLPAGRFRHKDHRFEWTRTEFAAWANHISRTFGYQASISYIGDEDGELGAPTQMVVFDRT